jgi:hypothetical protein
MHFLSAHFLLTIFFYECIFLLTPLKNNPFFLEKIFVLNCAPIYKGWGCRERGRGGSVGGIPYIIIYINKKINIY